MNLCRRIQGDNGQADVLAVDQSELQAAVQVEDPDAVQVVVQAVVVQEAAQAAIPFSVQAAVQAVVQAAIQGSL